MDDLRDDNVIVEVLSDNSILLNDRNVPAPELDELLRREMNESGMNEIIIKAAGAAHHETVVRAYDAASEAGAQRIRWPPSKGSNLLIRSVVRIGRAPDNTKSTPPFLTPLQTPSADRPNPYNNAPLMTVPMISQRGRNEGPGDRSDRFSR